MQQPGSHREIKVALCTENANKYELMPRWILFGLWPCRASLLPATATGLGHESWGCCSKDLSAKSCVWGRRNPFLQSELLVWMWLWLLLECSHVATSGSYGSDDAMVCAALRLLMPFREWQRGREETQWEMKKRKDQAWAVFVNKQNLTLSSEFRFWHPACVCVYVCAHCRLFLGFSVRFDFEKGLKIKHWLCDMLPF